MITFCIPSKNNLRYLKGCIASIQKNSYYKNNILVFVDQDNDGTENWLKSKNIDYISNNEAHCKGIGYAYDTMFRSATTDYVVAFHADMILGKNGDLNLLKHSSDKTIVCSTRIEPKLHPESPEKITIDLGLWPEDFQEDNFNYYVNSFLQKNNNKINNGVFAPWLIKKSEHINHDSIFLSVFEDCDLFLRYKIAGFNFIQSLDSIVYHLTCRGGQFEHASETIDLNTKSDDWKHKSNISHREFIRKWGSNYKHTEFLEPIIIHKYGVGLVVNNCNLELLRTLEPWCDKIYIEDGYGMITTNYIDEEQKNTKFDLSRRIRLINHHDPICENDIVVEFDGTMLNQNNFIFIERLSEILTENEISVGYYEMDIFKFHISSVRHYENDLIKIVNNYA